MREASIFALFGAFMHGETEANFFEESVHFWGVLRLLHGEWQLSCGFAGERRRELFSNG